MLKVLPLCTSLVDLDISGNELGDHGVSLIKASLTASSVKDAVSGLTGTIAAIAANALNRQAATRRRWEAGQGRAPLQLQRLVLSNNGLRAKGARDLSELLRVSSSLRTLVLTDNLIGDEGTSYLAASLKANSSLLELDLGGNRLTGVSALDLAEALRDNPSLQVLRLPRNNLLDEAAVGLAAVLPGNTTLRILDMSGCRVSDEGAVALAEGLGSNRSLRSLRLHDNLISELGGQKLCEHLQAHLQEERGTGASIGGLYQISLQGNGVNFGTQSAAKAVCEARRKHDQVPHTVHGQIFELQPAEPALEVTSTQLGVECIFDDRAVAQLSDLSGQLARLKAEVDEAVAASDLLFKRHRESTKKFTREADASREEMRSVTAKFDVEKVQVREEVAVLQRKKMQLEALELVGNARSQTASGTTGDPKAAGEVHSAPAEVSIEAELDGFKPLDEKARRLVNAPPR